ncbi:B-type lectin plumieribetin-like [Antennarius striatus]|uniref:B-type lectin plumieribetin-like n=1 Tax=Antennarius striatus TaxID=241820 RepID=UPI0035B47F05
MSRNFISKNDELRLGDFLISNNGQWKAVFQEDGNLVVYGWKLVWDSDTKGLNPFRLRMQEDCNLVMYREDGEPVWQANCAKDRPEMCRLCLTDDGKLVVNREAKEIWNSAKSKGIK